ncbi:hypothetical protein VNO78_09601 [Psophocarpus tetragonolobus]|uniref:FBD domain-containing protein n=1 Tax=Psophocarpus tetragonolobus TaxID=3891 RepID=A0AAN9XU64_PSOTE
MCNAGRILICGNRVFRCCKVFEQMSRSEKGADCGEHIDRISELPISRLMFNDDFFKKCKHLGYIETSTIITEVLFLHKGLNLVSHCPLIEHFTLDYCSGFEHLNVSSPFLEALHIKGEEALKSICLKQAQNLFDLKLLGDEGGDNIERGWVSDLVKDLPKIERLCIGRGYIKNLSVGVNPRGLFWPFNTLKYLKLGVNFNEVEELMLIISLLESSPNLEELVIKSQSKDVQSQIILKEFDCYNCYFSKLQTVKIIVEVSFEHALKFVQFVLAKSPSLEILTFKVGHLGLNESDAPTLFRISRDLLQMQRASPRAKVKILYLNDE